MAYRIKLTFEAPVITEFEGKDTFRFVCTASDAENMPNEIFVHQKIPVNVADDTYQESFQFVSGVYDLSEWPVNTPDASKGPYFRKNTVDILLPGISLYAEVKEKIKIQVCSLLELMEKLDELSVDEEYWCPGAPEVPSSSSSSSL